MDIPVIPTPPGTQGPLDQHVVGKRGAPVRHKKYYYTGTSLMDPLIMRAGDTLYRISRHFIIERSHIFAAILSLENFEAPEGGSDDRPILLPPQVTPAHVDVFLWYQNDYDPSPSQEILVNVISISRRWFIHNLFGYALDKLSMQFEKGLIHPAVVLGVARTYGIPQLVEPAVKALAQPTLQFASWATEGSIISHNSAFELGVIGRMKEKLLMARMGLCTPPPSLHDDATCLSFGRAACATKWIGFWYQVVVPKLLKLDGRVENELWWIRGGILESTIPGMGERCGQMTILDMVGKPAWKAETNIPHGAIQRLMVDEQSMMDPAL